MGGLRGYDMARKELRDREITAYLGKPEGDDKITKDELGEFITDEMGLRNSDGDPSWSEGITELLSVGIRQWDTETKQANPEMVADLREAKQTIRDLRDERENLKEQIQTEQTEQGYRDAATRQHRLEARVLEILCRDEHLGVDTPNLVPVIEVAQQTGLDHDAVGSVLDALSKPHNGELVTWHDMNPEAKARHENVFEDYCNENPDFSADEIRRMNQ